GRGVGDEHGALIGRRGDVGMTEQQIEKTLERLGRLLLEADEHIGQVEGVPGLLTEGIGLLLVAVDQFKSPRLWNGCFLLKVTEPLLLGRVDSDQEKSLAIDLTERLHLIRVFQRTQDVRSAPERLLSIAA